MPKEINWDDADEVAKLRGDVAEDGEGDKDADAKKPEAEAEAEDKKAEGDDGGGKDADKKDGDKEPLIPKSRLDAKNKLLQEERERREALEAKLAEADARDRKATQDNAVNAQAQRMQVLNDTVIELDTKINDALADGDRTLATRLRGEQRQLERQIIRAEMDEQAVQTSSQTKEEMRLDMTVDHLEEIYPQLNPDGDEFDSDLVTQIQELRAGFVATGKYTQTQALLQAVSVYIPTDERVKAADDGTGKSKQNEVKDERKEQALRKAVDAQGKQPPDLDGVGDDSDKQGLKDEIDTKKLTFDDLESMPLEKLKQLRGDHRV